MSTHSTVMLKFFSFFLFTVTTVSAQTQFFNSFDETQIAYTDEGEGDPVLLIHGFINTKEAWDQTALKKQLLKNGFRVITLDLRGNGESDKPQEGDAYAYDAEVMDIMFLMQHLRFRKYLAVGYSRGSIVLAKLLTKDKRIKKAVLGGMGIDFTDRYWTRRILFMNAFAGKETEETKGAVDYAKSIGADLYSLHLQQKYQPVTSKRELSYIKAKVLVIAGNNDLDNGSPEDLHRAIPKSKLKIVKGDHNGTYKTEPFAEAVFSFLD